MGSVTKPTLKVQIKNAEPMLAQARSSQSPERVVRCLPPVTGDYGRDATPRATTTTCGRWKRK
jgi:hypothetical protein